MIYEYKCPEHPEQRELSSERGDTLWMLCRQCNRPTHFKRVWAVNIHRPMADHFNTTTNSMIGSNRQFKEELKAASYEATARTGIEHNFEPVDRGEMRKYVEASGAVGLEGTMRQRKKDGLGTIDI